MEKPQMFSKDPNDYIKVALAIETLAYHNLSYLWTNDNAKISAEMQKLLAAALVEKKEKSNE